MQCKVEISFIYYKPSVDLLCMLLYVLLQNKKMYATRGMSIR